MKKILPKYTPGIILLLGIGVLLVLFLVKSGTDHLESSFGETYIAPVETWSTYTNKPYRFSIEVPPGMGVRQTVGDVLREGESEKIYSIELSDPAHVTKIFSVFITPTDLVSVRDFVDQQREYQTFLKEERQISGVPAILVTSPQDQLHPHIEGDRERHLLFIHNRHLFDVVIRNLSPEDIVRIIGGVRLLEAL